MGVENKNNVQNAEGAALKTYKKPNILSRIFLWWMCPVLITGNRRNVEESDLIPPSNLYNSERQGEYLERYWLQEIENATNENREPSLWKALQRAYLFMS
uniref:Truncated ABC transporter family C protein ABCC2 n=1 Tax=Heliothis virescens TaxID=7102 RepID=D8V117_HELVI|nr:truncated ABC transporter family C protein ABCC2 [Heliothis virescens]